MNFKLHAFFKVTHFTMVTAAAFPLKTPSRSPLNRFLLYKVFPVVFMLVLLTMFLSVVLKLKQFIDHKDWEHVLESIHIIFVGAYCLFALVVTQRSASLYKKTMDTIQLHFTAGKSLRIREVYVIFILWVGFCIAYILYIGACIYYGEVLLAVWVPFIDNDKELTSGVFWFVWFYQCGAAYYILCCLAIFGPFIIVASICIGKELDHLTKRIAQFSPRSIKGRRMRMTADGSFKITYVSDMSANCSDRETQAFIKYFVDHHSTVRSALEVVSRIHSPIFLTQTGLTVVHSCFLTFNMYYTSQLGKVLIKSSPILFLSYFIMFIYCWNGQQLTDKCEELYRAMYRCPWYRCPRKFRTSLLLIMEMSKHPLQLSGYGVFPATHRQFLKCVQQSISYIMLLFTLSSKP